MSCVNSFSRRRELLQQDGKALSQVTTPRQLYHGGYVCIVKGNYPASDDAVIELVKSLNPNLSPLWYIHEHCRDDLYYFLSVVN